MSSDFVVPYEEDQTMESDFSEAQSHAAARVLVDKSFLTSTACMFLNQSGEGTSITKQLQVENIEEKEAPSSAPSHPSHVNSVQTKEENVKGQPLAESF